MVTQQHFKKTRTTINTKKSSTAK